MKDCYCIKRDILLTEDKSNIMKAYCKHRNILITNDYYMKCHNCGTRRCETHDQLLNGYDMKTLVEEHEEKYEKQILRKQKLERILLDGLVEHGKGIMKNRYCKKRDILITRDEYRCCDICGLNCETMNTIYIKEELGSWKVSTITMEDLVEEYKNRMRESKLKRILE